MATEKEEAAAVAEAEPAAAVAEEKPKAEKKSKAAQAAAPAGRTSQVMELVKAMNVLELAGLVKALEQEFGVTAQAPMVLAAAPAAAGAAPAAEEKTEFDLILVAAGEKKIQVIKVVRELTGLGLKEAKDLVDGAPRAVKEKVSKADAQSMKAKLEEVGAQVEVK